MISEYEPVRKLAATDGIDARAADIAGIRCLLVHAKDDAARQWYLFWDFEPSPSDPYHLFLLIKDLKACWRLDPSARLSAF